MQKSVFWIEITANVIHVHVSFSIAELSLAEVSSQWDYNISLLLLYLLLFTCFFPLCRSLRDFICFIFSPNVLFDRGYFGFLFLLKQNNKTIRTQFSPQSQNWNLVHVFSIQFNILNLNNLWNCWFKLNFKKITESHPLYVNVFFSLYSWI